MICRHCGTEIADKALICYRCGAGTSDPVRKPPTGSLDSRRSPLWSFLVVLALAIAGLYLGQAQIAETARPVGWVLLGLSVLLLVWTLLRRRPRRRR
jgi:hypothetical protein